ncbi:class I SAM-dependent methyltransferase [Nostoc sp. CHAB 5844]|nr:class I SAM-dependent methyltransferase [Nostoc sp. CHAB 5844]
MNNFSYIGEELVLFAQAKNWKNYLRSLLREYIKGDVLEVGAGIGSNTHLLCQSSYRTWLCLEPDTVLFNSLKQLINVNCIINCSAINGTINSLNEEQLFDLILYIDVLEHISDDQEELVKASQHLKKNGKLIVLSPSHQWLFTSFDLAVGHYRRYNKSMLKAILPDDIEIIKLDYLDCIGLLASLSNKLFLKQSQPTFKQIAIWDKFMIPISRIVDKILSYRLGKSILLIGRKKFL